MNSGRGGCGLTGSAFHRWGKRSRDVVVSLAVDFAVYRVAAFKFFTGNAVFGSGTDSMTTVSAHI